MSNQESEEIGGATAFMLCGAVGLFGVAVGITELGSAWSISMSTPFIYATIAFCLVVAFGFLVLKTPQSKLFSIIVGCLLFAPFAAWSQASVRQEVFKLSASILPPDSLEAAVKNDPHLGSLACKAIGALENGPNRLFALSLKVPTIGDECFQTIARSDGGIRKIIEGAKNDDAFCVLIGKFPDLKTAFVHVINRSGISLTSQRCVSAEIDARFESDEDFIAFMKDQNNTRLNQSVAILRSAKLSERLTSDAFGMWLFEAGCEQHDGEVLASVGLSPNCPTALIESGWPNVCERVASNMTMANVCKVTRFFTVGLGVQEGKRLVHRAIRRFEKQKLADSIAGWDGGYNPFGQGGGSKGISKSPFLEIAEGSRNLDPSTRAAMPAQFAELTMGILNPDRERQSEAERAESDADGFDQIFGGIKDGDMAAWISQKGGVNAADMNMKDILKDENLTEEEIEELEKEFAEFKKQVGEKGLKKMMKEMKLGKKGTPKAK